MLHAQTMNEPALSGCVVDVVLETGFPGHFRALKRALAASRSSWLKTCGVEYRNLPAALSSNRWASARASSKLSSGNFAKILTISVPTGEPADGLSD